ncbi:hypothetical protein I2I11_08040 [Pontibacter sp. 172403-2]|uniref:hypothetical protein n=1 Tax=Pontibacter rufus TaxID=2791028 RepID=UPI0018AFDD92|nr:hypothetical protein [Pontibacter sp. 172403-2]MBF9253238.1 hypothetical protein [Pontibacter sp. 172403-2]
MNENLSWRELKALNDIYTKRQSKAKIQEHPYIKYLFEDRGILDQKFANTKVLIPAPGYDQYYESKRKEGFRTYQDFFEQHSFLKPQSNYKERDIRVLMLIAGQKQQILTNQYSRKKFSAKFFNEAKYLVQGSSLEKAVLSILELDGFLGSDPKDQQYRIVLDCRTPQRIVLCENLDFLLYPEVARENNIWLWYVGGNNIKKLDHLPPINLPIYYSCDWDYHGLKIYQEIKEKMPQIELLFPSAIDAAKTIYSDNHKSDWLYDVPFSGLKQDCVNYSERAIGLIEKLIIKKEWIEEESNDLLEMINLIS